jgi:4a-hydroxytetrahydrobiopterin dehydratase
MHLSEKKCLPCEGIGKTLTTGESAAHLESTPGWAIANQAIERNFEFKDFPAALAFVNRVGEIAEAEGHHPDIFIHGWNKVRLALSTHALDGLTENDFIVAAKVNALLRNP